MYVEYRTVLYFYQQLLSHLSGISLDAMSFTLFHGLKKITTKSPDFFGPGTFTGSKMD
jgi:hypothetical protein